jgi:hypothetical protein
MSTRVGIRWRSGPFRESNAHRDALRELKRAVVRLGNSGDRKALKLARILFAEIPGLKEA